MVFVSFPGDEKSSGGCIAAGRGFFHINSHGGLLNDDHQGGCVLFEKRDQVVDIQKRLEA